MNDISRTTVLSEGKKESGWGLGGREGLGEEREEKLRSGYEKTIWTHYFQWKKNNKNKMTHTERKRERGGRGREGEREN